MEKRKSYGKQFKLEAVRLLDQGNQSAAELARELGVRRNQLYKWKAQLSKRGEGQAFQGPGRRPLSAQSDELAQLKQEVAALREERDILKKAAVYFAKESP